MNKKELETQIGRLKDRMKKLEIRDEEFFGYTGGYILGGMAHVAGKFDKLLKYLGIEYKEEQTTKSEGKFHKASSKKKKA